MIECYVALGGNFPNTYEVMEQVLHKLANHPEIKDLNTSRLYQTTPISDLPQDPYLNAVCRFFTSLDLKNLWNFLRMLEKKFHKKPKPKNAPRVIDLDLLFYGDTVYNSPELVIPHPRWYERLFVLAPLGDLVSNQVVPLAKSLPYPVMDAKSCCS